MWVDSILVNIVIIRIRIALIRIIKGVWMEYNINSTII